MGITFAECLSSLLSVFNINGSKLAKGINIDQSLVYKWLRNERAPAFGSPYVDLITGYLTDNLNNNPHLTHRIIKFLQCDNAKPSRNIDIKTEIQTMLYKAQNHSLDLRNNQYNPGPSLQILNNSTDLINIIKGNKAVFDSIIDLIGKAAKNCPNNNNTILVTLSSNIAFLPHYKEFNARWKKAMMNAINNGWKVIFFVRLNDDTKRTIRIIEDMHIALNTNKFSVYYDSKALNLAAGSEFIIVPETGALFCFSSSAVDEMDTAFLFQSTESIAALTGHFCQSFSSAKPLCNTYPPQKFMEFQKLFVKVEEQMGDRFVFKGGHSTITIPSNLYAKYIKHNIKKEPEISQRLNLHRKRLDAFKEQIKFYKFRDIWFKESIERLIFEKKYWFDEDYILGSYVPEKEDIDTHVENIIFMLEEYQNYEVALTNEKDYKDMSKICWMVKGSSYVMIEAIDTSGDDNAEVNLAITEERFVAAYREYFLNLWNNIPPVNKSKDYIIEWLKSLLKKTSI